MHAHGHGHAHAEGRPRHASSSSRRLLWVIAFATLVLVAEVVGGLLANSLVLLSDAAHMSTDIAAIALAWLAARVSMRPPDAQRTYGYYRAETLAAFVNALALWVLSAWLLYEAWHRLQSPQAVDGLVVAGVGVLGLVANAAMALAVHAGAEHNLNLRGAYIHILSDAVGSLAAIATGLAIGFYGLTWLDPAATVLVSVLIVIWTWRLTRETLHILLEGTPTSLSHEEIARAIRDVPGVRDVHDLHVWSLTRGVDNLSAHVLVADVERGPDVVRAIREHLRERYRLSHVTIEVEGSDSSCVGCL